MPAKIASFFFLSAIADLDTPAGPDCKSLAVFELKARMDRFAVDFEPVERGDLAVRLARIKAIDCSAEGDRDRLLVLGDMVTTSEGGRGGVRGTIGAIASKGGESSSSLSCK